MQRVLICGDRNWTDYPFFLAAMEKWIAKHGIPSVLIEGCARGADSMAGHRFAVEMNQTGKAAIYVEHYPALWDKHGKAAGPIRNQQMLDEGRPDAVIAFHTNLAASRGTADMVRRAKRAGIPVWVPYPQPQQELFPAPVEHQDSGIATDF